MYQDTFIRLGRIWDNGPSLNSGNPVYCGQANQYSRSFLEERNTTSAGPKTKGTIQSVISKRSSINAEKYIEMLEQHIWCFLNKSMLNHILHTHRSSRCTVHLDLLSERPGDFMFRSPTTHVNTRCERNHTYTRTHTHTHTYNVKNSQVYGTGVHRCIHMYTGVWGQYLR